MFVDHGEVGMAEDPQRAAWEYRQDRLAREEALARGDEPTEVEAASQRAAWSTEAQRAAFIENTIQQAIRRGEFDDLPGAGKPIEGLTERRDPDWWIRRKIERENLTGLGPPALMLRVEHAEFEDRLDRLHREAEVREAVEDFNRRVIEARRQLLGGPPVVTPTREVEAEVQAWRERRDARHRRMTEPEPGPTRPERFRMWRRTRDT